MALAQTHELILYRRLGFSPFVSFVIHYLMVSAFRKRHPLVAVLASRLRAGPATSSRPYKVHTAGRNFIGPLRKGQKRQRGVRLSSCRDMVPYRGGYSSMFLKHAKSGLMNVGRSALSAAKKAAQDEVRKVMSGGGMEMGLYTGGNRGLYTPHNVNNIISGGRGLDTNSVPNMLGNNDETGDIVICHREYVQDIYAPGVAGSGVATSFSLQAFSLNPGLQNSFTWLSQIAENYDEYEFIQLIYHYRSTTTDVGNSTSGQCGTVVMATNYNASADIFVDKQNMVEYVHAHSCKLTEHMSHGVECDPSKTAGSSCLYVRTNPVVPSQDLKTYDHGKFQIAICNCPVAYNGFPVGELWVEYSVRLSKPKLYAARGLNIDCDIFTVVRGNSSSCLNPMGNVAANILTGQQNNIGCLINVATSGVVSITFPAQFSGNMRISLSFFASTTELYTTQTSGFYGSIGTGSNIIFNPDLYGTALLPTFPSSFCITPFNAVQQALTTAEKVNYLIQTDIIVGSATQGYNNVFNINLTGGNSTLLSASCYLSISSYQAFGANPVLNKTLAFLNASGLITVP